MSISTDLDSVLQTLAEHLNRTRHRVATAESCTGGLLAGAFTRMPGSSNWYEGGYVTYRLTAKKRLLGIHDDTLKTYGAVSEVVARQMVEHTLHQCDAQIAVATTGLAGPEGDGTATQVGTLWVAWAGIEGTRSDTSGRWTEARRFKLPGERGSFRHDAVHHAVAGLWQRLRKTHSA